MPSATPLLGVVVSLLALAPALNAGTIAYSDPAYSGNQYWGGELAQGFDVIAPIRVSRLGVFDSASETGFIGTVSAAIFSITPDGNGGLTYLNVSGTLTFSGTDPSTAGNLIGGDRFLNLATLLLLAPGSYEIVTAWPNDFNGNSVCDGGGCGAPGTTFTAPALDTGSGLISFTGDGYGGYNGAELLSLPLTSSRYFNAGSFQFDDAAAPEPHSAVLALFGTIFALAAKRRRLL